MNKTQIELFNAKEEKLRPDDIVYINGFFDCIKYLHDTVMNAAHEDALNITDSSFRYPVRRLFSTLDDALEEKLIDELFRRMDGCVEHYQEQDIPVDMDDDDFLIDTDDDDIPDPEWMECENDCASCSSDTCNHRTEEYQVVDDIYDPGSILPDSSIDFMNIGNVIPENDQMKHETLLRAKGGKKDD